MKTLKNDIILFLVMLVIGLIGFNLFNTRYGNGTATMERAAANPAINVDQEHQSEDSSGSSSAETVATPEETSKSETR